MVKPLLPGNSNSTCFQVLATKVYSLTISATVPSCVCRATQYMPAFTDFAQKETDKVELGFV